MALVSDVRWLVEVLMPAPFRRRKPQKNHRVVELLHEMQCQLHRMEDRIMATQADVDALTGRLSTVSTTLTDGIAGVRQDIEDLKNANPELDLSSLESSVATLETGVASVTELDGENPAAPVEPTDPGEPA